MKNIKYIPLFIIIFFIVGCSQSVIPEKEILIQEKTVNPVLPPIEIPELNLEKVELFVPDDENKDTPYVCFDYENWIKLKDNLVSLSEYTKTLRELIDEENKMRENWRNENLIQ